MRSTLFILLISIFIVVTAAVSGRVVLEREAAAFAAGERIGVVFAWPDHLAVADPAVTIRILTEAADKTGSNVVRTTMSISADGRSKIAHHVYLGRERSELFDEFVLAEGRWPTRTELNGGTARAASAHDDGVTVVGRLSVLADRFDLRVDPLRSLFETLPTVGDYVVEAPDDAARGRFLDIVNTRIRQAGVTDVTVKPTEGAGNASSNDRGLLVLFRNLLWILIAVAGFLAVTLVFREGKWIGVMRMVGFSVARIWYRTVGRLQFVALGVGTLCCGALMFFVTGADREFAVELAAALLMATSSGIALTAAVAYVMADRVRVGELVKGGLM